HFLKMNCAYAVVKFLEDGSFQEVPVVWLSQDRKYCNFPKKRCSYSYFKKTTPSEDWKKYRIERHMKMLRKRATIPNYITTDEEDRGRGKRSIFRKYSSSEDSDSSNKSFSPPTLMKKTNLPDKNQLDYIAPKTSDTTKIPDLPSIPDDIT
ncbi:hypothetical protein NQ317_010640, partial [Molorchus minor]